MTLLSRGRRAAALLLAASALVVPFGAAAPAQAAPDCTSEQAALNDAQAVVVDKLEDVRAYRTETLDPAKAAVVTAGEDKIASRDERDSKQASFVRATGRLPGRSNSGQPPGP